MSSVTPASVSDKELRRTIKTIALPLGWDLQQAGSSHFALVKDGHRIPVASSPSDTNAHKNLTRRIRRCEEGRCEHTSGPMLNQPTQEELPVTIAHPPSPGPTVTPQQAEERYGIKRDNLANAARRGSIKQVRAGTRGGKVKPLYDEASVAEYMRTRAKQQKPDAEATGSTPAATQPATATPAPPEQASPPQNAIEQPPSQMALLYESLVLQLGRLEGMAMMLPDHSDLLADAVHELQATLKEMGVIG